MEFIKRPFVGTTSSSEIQHLKKATGLDSAKPQLVADAKTQVVDELRSQHRLSILLLIAGLPRSTFFIKKRQGNDLHRNEKEQIATIFHHHKGRYGYRRITIA
ncbi:transposase [Candidatus Erwinia dacicola]|nr:transposase [Candidatus Erwinia dacicola]